MKEHTARALAQRQLDAYNGHDLDAFAACYAEDVQVLRLATGQVLCQGRDALRAQYAELLAPTSTIHARLADRMVLGRFAVDLERVTGRGADDRTLGAIAIYEVNDDDLISRVWFIGPEPWPGDAIASPEHT